METIIVSISTLINIISVPYLMWRVGTIDKGIECSNLRLAIEVLIFAVALAITVRYSYCVSERERR